MSARGEHRQSEASTVKLSGLAIVANSPAARQSAKRLRAALGKIYGREFEFHPGDGTEGIALGTVADFPELPFKPHFDLNNPGQRQGYEIKTHPKGIYVIAATPQALDYAVSDLLYRLGYRWFVPTPAWEIIPEAPPSELNLHVREVPDYYTRIVQSPWNSHLASWFDPETASRWREWEKNRRMGGYKLNTGHIVEQFIRQNSKLLKERPEYLALVKGKRQSTQLCLSNPELRKAFNRVEPGKTYPKPGNGRLLRGTGGQHAMVRVPGMRQARKSVHPGNASGKRNGDRPAEKISGQT